MVRCRRSWTTIILSSMTALHAADGIKLVTVAKGETFPAAPVSSIIRSSVPCGWRGIVVEWHHLNPQELPEHYVEGHGITVNVGHRPIPFGWKDDDKRVEGVMNPGQFHLLTHGESNVPRWSSFFDEVSLVLDPRFVAEVAEEGLPSNTVQFVTQRSSVDATIAKYADAFRAELTIGS